MSTKRPIHVESRVTKNDGEYYVCELNGGKVLASSEFISQYLQECKRKGEQPLFDAVWSDTGRVVHRDGYDIPEADFPEKERIIVSRLRKFIEDDDENSIALVAGIRQVGKTTALLQLLVEYSDNAFYFNMSAEGATLEALERHFANRKGSLLLIDEITHLLDYEREAQHLYNWSKEKGFKIIITGSSPAHIIKLGQSNLGGGRSKLFRLQPVSFVEYLLLTGRIPSYKEYGTVTNDDFVDYLMLKDLRQLRVHFDGRYFGNFYEITDISNRARYLTHSRVALKSEDLTNMCNLLAYKLNEACEYDKAIRPEQPGKAEYNNVPYEDRKDAPKYSDLDLSDAILCDSMVGMSTIPARDKGRILSFLLWSGLACIEFTKTGEHQELLDVGSIVDILDNCSSETELRHLFEKVSICLSTPLFYTRLGVDLLRLMKFDIGTLCRQKGFILGKMLEVYVRGALALLREEDIMSSIKLNYIGLGEVDVYDPKNGLLCESSIGNKGGRGERKVSINNYSLERAQIRFCSSRDRDAVLDGVRHIPYARLCCMIDTGDILNL